MIFTIMAYKQDNIDTCMGCVVGRYDSDFQWKSTTDEAEVTQFIASILVEDSQLDHYECEHEITFLIDGEEYPDSEDHQEIKSRIEANAKQIADGKIAGIKAAKEKIEADKSSKEQDRKAAAERKQYEDLKAKFEGM